MEFYVNVAKMSLALYFEALEAICCPFIYFISAAEFKR